MREAIKKVIRNCVLCRKLQGQPFQPGISPDSPAERVSEDPPFHHTGMDFAAPYSWGDQQNFKKKAKVERLSLM